MTRSNQQTTAQWVPSWDAMKLLELEKTTDKAFYNCVGDTQKGRRCGCQIARHNAEAGKHLLLQLPRRSIHPQLLEDDLRAIAYKLLCVVRWHRDTQVERMVQRWRPVILAENARAKARFFQAQTRQSKPKTERNPGYSEQKFKQEDFEDQKASPEQPRAGESDTEGNPNASNGCAGRSASEEEEFLERERQRCEEARRQSRRERAEQKEAKARAEQERAREQREEEEARRRKRDETPPPPRPQPRPSSAVDWETSWTTYRQRWILIKDLPPNSTLADLEKVFPWPLRNIYQLGLCKCKLDALFEKEVEAFFRHIPSLQAAADDKKLIVKALRKEALCWHPDKVLVRFPVRAVPQALRELATKITQVLTRLMGLFRV